MCDQNTVNGERKHRVQNQTMVGDAAEEVLA